MVPEGLSPINLEASLVREILSTVNQFLHPKLSINFKIWNIDKPSR